MALLKEFVRNLTIRVLLAWERLESGVAFNPWATRANPYDNYRDVRERDPVHRSRLLGGWVLMRHVDVDALLRDHRQFVVEGRSYGYTPHLTMLDYDPPQHTRLRSLVVKAFTPRTVEKLEPRIRDIVDELLEAIGDQPRFDLVQSVAFPLPVIVIAEMLGVPARDMDRFRAWSDDIACTVEPLLDAKRIRAVQRATEDLFSYFEERIEERRRNPGDTILDGLMAAENEGDRLTREELLSTLMLLLVAGNETTRNLISNGMLAMLRHPDQMQQLRDHPERMDAAIGEMLRYDSPVQLDGRIAQVDTEIGGRRIRAGDRVVAILGAANRDPDVFPDPDGLDFTRDPRNHIAFGRGVHHCLGSALAVLEGRVVFDALLRRFPSIRLAEEPVHGTQLVLRGLKELWIEVG